MKPQTTHLIKTGEFIIGFVGWFVIYGLYWVPILLVGPRLGDGAIIVVLFFFLALLANIIALILLLLLSLTRWRWIPLGALLAFTVNSILNLVLLSLLDGVEVDSILDFAFYVLSGIPFFSLLLWL